jgi:hypothetical protein
VSKISRFPVKSPTALANQNEINELYFLVAISERDQVPEIVQHDLPYYTYDNFSSIILLV